MRAARWTCAKCGDVIGTYERAVLAHPTGFLRYGSPLSLELDEGEVPMHADCYEDAHSLNELPPDG